ncbi:MAG TPA: hypothetical protein VG146_02550 [Verrucomicrobiae bacterium]|nr:hypothetical protein [Verrucomicrobiae bacterium]
MRPEKPEYVRVAMALRVTSVALIGLAIYLAALTQMPWPDIAALGFLGASLLTPWIPSKPRHPQIGLSLWAAAIAWFSTLFLAISLILARQTITVFDPYYAILAWLIAAAAALHAPLMDSSRFKAWWKALSIPWAFCGAFVWLAASYLQDRTAPFYIGLLVLVFLLLLCKRWFPMPASSVLIVNTLLVLVILLPIADWVARSPRPLDPHPEVAGTGYLYDVAKKEPNAFLHWYGKYLNQYDRLVRDLFQPDPAGVLPFRIRTNTNTTFFQSRIHINSLGFRGREISPAKGRAYRIVALGESNTFGFTLTPEHKPWPEALEQLFREHFRGAVPIEVINAGLPNHGLENNLYRLRKDILPLHPDMILSYHGWNTFRSLFSSLPANSVKHPPAFKQRPMPLLAKAEYRFKMLSFRKQFAANPAFEPPPVSKLLQSACAEDYRQLIKIARSNHIRLVIGNYSMAVDSQSTGELVEFYRKAFPAVYALIGVNQLNSLLLEELARQNPEVCLVDTHPQLDGAHDKFIDLVHFAPAGDRQMAETFFAAITNLVQQDLGGR